MSHLGRRITNIFFAFVLAVMSVNLSGVLSLQSTYAAKPPKGGNEGTFKVHEKGSPVASPDNEPKVCVFNFEGFDLSNGPDGNGQSGNITISYQGGPNNGNTVTTIPFSTDADGNGATPYINDTGSLYTLANGHYKATLESKFGYDNGDKEKSKVFKVTCNAVPSNPTVSAVPLCSKKTSSTGSATITVTNTDDDTDATASYTVTVTGQASKTVTNLADGAQQDVIFSNLAIGTYTVTVTGNDNTSATTTFKIEACTPETVIPTAPTPSDQCGTKEDTYTIIATPGVIYKVNGSTKAAGIYNVTTLQYLTGVHIVAYPANADVVLSGTTSWDFSFKSKACPAPTADPSKHEECGTDKDSYTIPSADHIKYYVNGEYKAAGTYYNVPPIAVITAVADNGYYPQGQAIWLYAFSSKPCPQPCHSEARDFIAPLTLNSQRHHQDTGEDCIPVKVAADEPTKSNVCGTKNDSYTIPETTGVEYYVDGVLTPAGEYDTNGKTSIEITTKTTDGYTFGDNEYTWTLTFTDEACEPEPCVPSTVTLPELKMLQTSSTPKNNCEPGQGGAGGEEPKTPVVVTELPMTGPAEAGDAFAKVALIVAAGITTYGAVFFAVNRRELLKK